MKHILILLLTGAALMLSACGAELKIGEASTAEPRSDPDVFLEIEEDSVNTHSLTLRVTNNSGEEIYSGNEADFAIETLQDDGWHSIETKVRDNTSEALIFDGERELAIDWSDIYGALPKGQYRFLKYFFPDDGDGFFLADTFEIG